VFKGLNIHFR